MAKKDPGKKAAGKGATRKPSATPSASPAIETPADDDSEAARRVAFLRHKLTKAMDDPLTRDQIVKAIRSMMAEGK
jgi:hypothetical protein